MDLGENKLTGNLPADIHYNLLVLEKLSFGEIGNLNLESLFLDINFLSGLIPFGIFNISMIVEIVLSSNHFSSNLPSSMGIWLPNLQKLIIDNNKLSGSILNSISNASKLTIIGMSKNSFIGSIPNTLSNLRDLQWLVLRGNNLTREVSTP
ncbi:hypothetical protein LguiA_004690 [Lonicera macranthoides]